MQKEKNKEKKVVGFFGLLFITFRAHCLLRG